MTHELIVERCGVQTIVVDAGRFGLRHEGIAWCGPADTLAYDIANTMLCNDHDAAALEIAFGDVRVRFGDARAFALTGADCDASLDGKACAAWGKHLAREGSVLTLRAPKRNVFSYVAIGGGIDVPRVLGSRTTDRLTAIGGYSGRALRNGDRLSLAHSAHTGEGFRIAPPPQRDTVRMVAGAEYEEFDEQSRELFFARAWSVGHESNRMGYRLRGRALTYRGAQLASHAVFPGVVQVPPSGEPIVLLGDAHTTGGYPKLGVVLDNDLRTVAQARTGDALHFTCVDTDEAISAAARRTAYLKTLSEHARERN